MFVLKSKYEAMRDRAWHAEAKADNLAWRLRTLTEQWRSLVGRINGLGGERFLQTARIPSNQPAQFTADDLQRLIMLCHPDKHDGKQMAVDITQKLLKMKESTK